MASTLRSWPADEQKNAKGLAGAVGKFWQEPQYFGWMYVAQLHLAHNTAQNVVQKKQVGLDMFSPAELPLAIGKEVRLY